MTADIENRRSGKPPAVIFGATGLVGRYLAQRLADRGFTGLCLSRDTVPPPYELPPGFSWDAVPEEGRLKIPASATLFSLAPVPALPALLARIAGGDRIIALSSSSAHFKLKSPDPDERNLAEALKRAEKEVRSLCQDRGIAWTIFRPTLIYDPGRDRNISAIAAFIRRFRVLPIVWPGIGRRQPIHADDVAQAMVAALHIPGARGARFDLPGGETLTYREMVRRVFESLGRRPVLLYLPLGPARVAFHVWQTATRSRYSAASLERMNMDLVLDPAPVRKTLGLALRPFRPEFPEPPNPRRASGTRSVKAS